MGHAENLDEILKKFRGSGAPAIVGNEKIVDVSDCHVSRNSVHLVDVEAFLDCGLALVLFILDGLLEVHVP